MLVSDDVSGNISPIANKRIDQVVKNNVKDGIQKPSKVEKAVYFDEV